MLDRLLGDVYEHLVAEYAGHVTHRVFGEYCRSRIAQTITFQVVIRNLADRAHALFARIFEIVEAGFECAAACLLGGFGQSFRTGLRGLPHAPVRKPELIPTTPCRAGTAA
ncbi:MAG TPA: hypothetical protein VFB14_02495 [Bryobacteraceae bacterium]|nr:hypothetical protein [Bryobacteraceae bacterium]